MIKLIQILFKNSKKLFILNTITNIISGASNAGMIALINHILRHSDEVSIGLAGNFIGLCLLMMLSTALSGIFAAKLSQEIIYNLRLEVIQTILASPLIQLEILGEAKLLGNITRDINIIASSCTALLGLVINIFLIIGCCIYLYWLSASVFLFFFILIFSGTISYHYITQKGIQRFETVREIQDTLFKHFQTVIKGIKELKLHHQRQKTFIKEDLEGTARELKFNQVRARSIYAIARAYGTGLLFIPLGILLLGLNSIMSIPAEVLTSYTLTFLYTISPIRGLLSISPRIGQGLVALNKIESLGLVLNEKITEPKLSAVADPKQNGTCLELVEIHHTYKEGIKEHQFSLENINLQFQPGEIVFIVGGNGSGKSTLIKIITGLYTPDRGQIIFNGTPINDHNREWYRQHFSVVFYDFYLFDRLFGIRGDRTIEIQDYLTRLELEHKVEVNDGFLSTTNLSQGQRKRLALLVAYLEDRPIYIFDEWTSDQDPIFKRVFYKKLLPELKNRGKTVIAISHDDRYFSECDRLIKLDYGQVEMKA